jgi:hypothetical protein
MIREDKPEFADWDPQKLPRITVIATQNINWKTSGFALGIVGVAPRLSESEWHRCGTRAQNRRVSVEAGATLMLAHDCYH